MAAGANAVSYERPKRSAGQVLRRLVKYFKPYRVQLVLAVALSVAGNLLALVSGVFYAGIFFTSRLPGADSLQSTILGNLMYVFFIPFLFTDQALMHPETTGVPAWQSWLAILFMGACQLGLSWICFSRGIKTTPSLQASFITMIEPVLNPLLALLILGEAMGTLSVIGSVLVVVTIVVHNVLTAKKEQATQETSKSA